MFKLDASIPQALDLAEKKPKWFEVGKNGWVTARFTAEEPLPKQIWDNWLAESYNLTCGAGRKPRTGE